MESNTSIIGRQVLCIDERKIEGRITELRVDCDTQKVSHLLTKDLAVPFESIIGIGDTFVTVQTTKSILKNAESRAVFMGGFKLLDAMAYTRMGNALCKVSGFNFDSVTGDVVDFTLEDDSNYVRQAFEFFVPEFVLVDPEKQPAPVEEIPEETVAEEEQPEPVEEVKELVPDEEDAELMQELIGQTTLVKVATEDESFVIEQGSKLTEEQINEAFKNGLLTDLSFAV